jgi:riboflavin kinase/FMN adenylyltransferase
VEDAGRVLLEVHVFDFNTQVYGRIIRVELLEKMRDEAKYPDLETLQSAIQNDAQCARDYFQKKVHV